MAEKKTKVKNEKLKEFWTLLESRLIELGTQTLKRGITNTALSQIDSAEEKIKNIIDKKIKEHKKTIVKIISFMIAGAFISYGLVEMATNYFNVSEYTNLIFGFAFLIIALITKIEND